MTATFSVTKQTPPADRETVIRLGELLFKFAEAHEKDTFTGAALKALFEHTLNNAKKARNIEALVRHWEESREPFSSSVVAEAKSEKVLPPRRVLITVAAMKKTLNLFDKPEDF